MRTTYFGDEGDNRLSATAVIRESIYGLGGDDIFFFYAGADNLVPDFDMSDRFFGGAGDDELRDIDLAFDGNGGLEQLAQLSFDGGTGYDTLAVSVTADLSSYTASTSQMDLGDIAPLLRSVEHRAYTLSLVDFQEDLERLTIDGSNADESLTLSQIGSMAAGGEIWISLKGGNDRFEYSAEIDTSADLVVDTGTGNDVVVMNAATTTYADLFSAVIRTRGGQDTVVLEGMYTERVNTGSHNDTIYVLSGSFAEAADVIRTGGGKDRIYLELDSYSTLARFKDFDADKDKIVFDADEFRNTTVTFNKTVWQNAEDDMLYMDNAAGKLYFGDNVLATFGTDAGLTEDSFIIDTWDYWNV